MRQLPIDEVLPQLVDTLQSSSSCVLQAPPGAGKTTRIPLALLDQPWLQKKKILMLEPRRLAARSAAYWMAHSLDEDIGETVGYRMRLEHKIGPRTRIEVVTEGILTRLIQNDAELSDYGIVIFDEFHERSLQADLGLALCLDVQESLRPELRLLVMSATLDSEPVSKLMGNASLISSAGRSFPVTTRYLDVNNDSKLETIVAQAVQIALQNEPGSILVFLPGTGEIHRTMNVLTQGALPANVHIYPLYADLPRNEQEAAIEPTGPHQRKIVLATSIAETSLTIDGVRVVIDSGLQRLAQFDPNTGMTKLITTRVSKAAADQRQGRAGRLEPGVCYRLWSEATHTGLVAFNAAEILQADLAPLALELAQWGVYDPTRLRWLDVPPVASFTQAKDLLVSLDCLTDTGRITDHGRRVAQLSAHPRLAHMMLKGKEIGYGVLACELAALLGERDLLRAAEARNNADLTIRVDVLRGRHQGDANIRQRVRETARRWLQQLKLKEDEDTTEKSGVLLAMAYPDRIAQSRSQGRGRYLLSNGKGAVLNEADGLCKNAYIAVAHLDAQGPDAKIYLAAAISLEDIQRYFSRHIHEIMRVEWDESQLAVKSVKQLELGQLVLQQRALTTVDTNASVDALFVGLRRHGLDVLPWTPTLRQWQQRVLFLRRNTSDKDWPDVSDTHLLATIDQWLAPYLQGVTRFSQLQNIDLHSAITQLLTWEQNKQLDEQAPTHCLVPSGSRIPVDYSQGDNPVLAVRLQEMFGLANTPCVANGRIPLTLHLLSPAHRPVQVTRDLANFWATTYAEVKKELKGRYPKHYWPDDPLQAQATHKAKPRK